MTNIFNIPTRQRQAEFVYRAYINFIEGESTQYEVQYPLIYAWLKREANMHLAPAAELDLWNQVASRPYTWDLAESALDKYNEAGLELKKGFDKLKAMDYGHTCCKTVFGMWGVDTTRVRALLRLEEAIAA